jgi:LmbE family N-acetylglucosaminyl deacetylase
MKHVYLSPHLDDALLSCGGGIHRLAAGGEPVLVVNVFAGDSPLERGSPPDGGLSSFAQIQHGYWGHPPRPMTLRRAEDAAALNLLGVEGQYLEYEDAVYRTGPGGEWLYTHEEALWQEVDPVDPMGRDGAQALTGHLSSLIPSPGEVVVYAPLGVGHHIDHQILHAAARQLLAQGQRVAFYEDYPYANQPGAVEAALAAAGAGRWRDEIVALEPGDVVAKIAALAYYRTQMRVLFGGAEAMPNRVWACAAGCSPEKGLAERIWWPPES